MKTSAFSLRPAPASGMRLSFTRIGLVSSLLLALTALPVLADDLGDVTKSVRAGQYDEALAKANAVLSKRPHDAQMRFLKGVILTEQGKNSEAIAVFTKLTEDFPELPEPYNNLAVLFAASGQYDKARLALDNAIRTNPTWATAYENLGDVHAKLASQAYDKALQLDSSNSAAKSKLTLLRTLAINNVNPAKGQTVAAVAPPPAPVAPPPVAKPVVLASAAPTPAAAPTAPVAAPVAKAAPAKPEAKVEPKPEAKPEPKPAAKPVVEKDDSDEVLAVVHGWARAWSEQNVKSYLGYYGSDFETPKGESRKDWAEERHQRIEGKNRIEVKIESPQVSINGNSATVKFRQEYVSDRLKANSRKVLVLTKQGGKWQIKQERAGS